MLSVTSFPHAGIAQSVEQRTENPCVPGSIPGPGTKDIKPSQLLRCEGFLVCMKIRLRLLSRKFVTTHSWGKRPNFANPSNCNWLQGAGKRPKGDSEAGLIAQVSEDSEYAVPCEQLRKFICNRRRSRMDFTTGTVTVHSSKVVIPA